MAVNSCQWLSMAANGRQWLSMAANGRQWLPMAANGRQWSPMVYQWSPMAANEAQRASGRWCLDVRQFLSQRMPCNCMPKVGVSAVRRRLSIAQAFSVIVNQLSSTAFCILYVIKNSRRRRGRRRAGGEGEEERRRKSIQLIFLFVMLSDEIFLKSDAN